MSFVHLHNHTHFSVLDGLATPDELAKLAKDFGQPALAITDHGTLAGHRDLQKACAEEGVKPILGLEAYISETDRFDRRQASAREDDTKIYNHIILLAKNEAGLKNLHHLSREAWESGYYHKPRIDFDLLSEYGDGIIVLSGCMSGIISKAIENGNLALAEKWARKFHDRFGADFYMEVQPHNPLELNQWLLSIADSLGIQSVATLDCHFPRPELRWVEEAMLILNVGRRNSTENYESTRGLDPMERYNKLYKERPISFADIDVYFMTREEAEKAFAEQNITRTDILNNTLAIAEKIEEYEYIKDKDFLPRISDDPDASLREKVFSGLERLGLADKQEYIDRAEEELSIIEEKNFAAYFLIMEDVVAHARKIGVRVGPGRGSAVGSLICYALDIIRIDPIEWGLLFFRFIDVDREDWPDIDVDFQRSRRGEIKEYIRKRFGHAASISNFVYFSEKGVIKDAARVFGVPISEANKVTKLLDGWDDYITSTNDTVMKFRQKYPEVQLLGDHLRGRLRTMGLHAGGVVTSREPIENFAPIETRDDPDDKRSGRIPVVAFDMRHCEEIGLLKLDILGVTELDIIEDAVQFIRKSHQPDFDEEKIPLDDPEVYKMLAKGHTAGTFQANAYAYTSLLKDMQVDNFKDLVVSNALVRPGARNTVGEVFIRRLHGDEPVNYVHESVEPFLSETFGAVVFQEQVMLAAMELGGLSGGEANKVRKIIGKKRDSSEFDEFREKFIKGASERISKQAATELWESFEEHAGYSFNKSHSVAYSLLTYWTAWLKLHYPLEYMTAMFRHADKGDKVDAFLEMRRLGLNVLLPDINKSELYATIDGNSIRLGLSDIKYISDKVYRNIKRHRPYKSFDDLIKAVETKGSGISSRTLGALQRAGATKNLKGDPAKYDIEENLYEYLNIPKFKTQELPDAVWNTLTPVDEFEEQGAFVMKGMVESIRRGDSWSIIEFLGERGKASAFDVKDTSIQEGQMYIFLIGNNSIIEYVAVDEFDGSTIFEKFLLSDGPKILSDEAVVVSFSQRFTKTRKLMGTVVLCNQHKELQSALVFPRQFNQVAKYMKPGKVIKPYLKQLKDGAYMVTGVSE